jgi:hypothetical protein
MGGADFLRVARVIAPDAVRMLLGACAGALAQYQLQAAERELLEQTPRGAVDALAEVLALTNPAAFGRAGRVRALAGKLAHAIELATRWEVEVAATWRRSAP